MEQRFDPVHWRACCDQIADAASGGCWLEYEERLSAAVERALQAMPAGHRARAVAMARSYGYATAQELAAAMRPNLDKALDQGCTHGHSL